MAQRTQFAFVGIYPADKSELESFRGELAQHLGRKVPITEAIRIAVRASRGKVSELVNNERSPESI